MKAGETKAFSLVFPADYHGKEVASKAADFTLTVKSVEEPKLPEVDAEFAKAFGVASGSLDELNTEIEANSQARIETQDRHPFERAGACRAPQQGRARDSALVGRARVAEHGRPHAEEMRRQE